MPDIRAIIYGVGRLNLIATRLMQEKGVTVVAAYNRAGPKVGQDLGELAGIGAIGVRISDDAQAVLRTPADIVMVGVHDDLERMLPTFEHCLGQGLNVISMGAHHSSSWRIDPQRSKTLDECAKTNGVTITGSGNQDFFMVNLGTLMSGVCHRLDRLIHRSLSNVNHFGPEVAEGAYVGEDPRRITSSTEEPKLSVYTTFWDNVAADLALDVIDIRQSLEPVLAAKPVYCKSLDRLIKPGMALGIIQRLEVTTRQGLAMLGENTLRVCEDGVEEYKEWEVEGEPNYKIRATELSTGLTTASSAVNRIPHVIQAPAGYVTLEQLPKLTYRARLTLD